MTEKQRHLVWSSVPPVQIRPARATSAPSLHALEAAAAMTPHRTALWQAALDMLRHGSATDADVGAGWSMHGERPLTVAVITPYWREDVALLRRCHESVRAQSYPCRHVMVADGAGRVELDAWDLEHLKLDRSHADFGDTPRAVGGEEAVGRGFGAVAYLDADNTLRPHHVESLVWRWRDAGVPVVVSGRTLHFPDGSLLPEVNPDDAHEHVDTNCLFLTGAALAMVTAWREYPRRLSQIDDRMIWRMLCGRGYAHAVTGALTACYTVNERYFYRALGIPIPADARPDFDPAPLADWYRTLDGATRVALETRLGFPVDAFLREFFAGWGIAL